jgi:hypothetical protein
MVPEAKRKPGVGAGLRMDTCMGEEDMQHREDNTDHDPSSRIGGGWSRTFWSKHYDRALSHPHIRRIFIYVEKTPLNFLYGKPNEETQTTRP